MSNLYARAVFFTDDGERSLRYYTEQLGFSMDSNLVEDFTGFEFLSAQGRTDEANQRLRPIFTSTGYAVDALALPVGCALWGRNMPK